MKKLIFIIPLLIFSCSSDDDSSSNESNSPTDFFGNHIGLWKTTIEGSIDILIDVDSNGLSTYNKLSTENCYNFVTPISGGTTEVVSNNSEEYLYETVNIPAENVFSADDLDFVNDLGYNYVDIAGAYLHTTDQIISYSEGIYGANSNVELLTVTGNMGKQTSSSFNLCDD
jgi:hypothetical protein